MYAAAYVWAKVISHLEQQLTEITVSAWLDDAELIEMNDEELIVYSPSDFRQEFIRERFSPYIHDAVWDLFHIHVKLVVWGDKELHAYRQMRKEINPVFFNPQFTFDSFVTGKSNQIAVEIARAAAEDPGSACYNPLFFYGPPGVGKTHLLYAIANHLQAVHPDKRVVYIRGDQFTNELVNAIKNGTTRQFKDKYRVDIDVLLVDDIQFIAGKESTQEEFFHTFNALYESSRQIVMTADRKPSDMATLEKRLCSRFDISILVGISPPDEDTRVSIIRSKARSLQLPLDEEIIAFIAANLTDNVRQIEGALKKVRAFRDLGSMELTLPNVARTIQDFCSGNTRMPVSAAMVIRNVCRYFGIDEQALKSSQKSRNIAEPRQIGMYLAHKFTKLNYTEIGREFGGRNHSTVLHSISKIEQRLQSKDKQLEGVIQDIISNMENTAA